MKKLLTIATHHCLKQEGSSQRKRNMLVRMMVMAVAMMMLAPSALKANDGRLSDDYYDIYTYNFSDYANNNVQPITGDAYKGAEQTAAVNVRGYIINGQQRDYLAFRFESSNPYPERRMRWWYENGGLHTDYYQNNANNADRCPILAVLGFRAGDKIRVYFEGNGSIKYRSPNDNYGNVHMVREWNNDGDFYTKGNNPTIANNVGYIITSDGDLILKADGDVTITSIQIFKVKDADYTLTKGTSQNGNPTYTCTFTGKGRVPSKNMAVPYLLCSFGHNNDYAVIDRSQIDWATGNYCYVFDYNWNQDMRKDDNSIPVGGTYYAFKPTATGYITVDGFLETINWQGSTANFYVFKYNLDNTIAYTDNNFHYAWKDGTPFTFYVEANYIYYLCEDARDNVKGRLHLTSFTFENTSMDVEKLGVVVDLEEGQTGAYITKVNGITSDDDFTASVKRVSSSINPSGLNLSIRENNGEKWFYLSGIAFNEHKDKAGTILYDVRAKNNRGEATIAITLPYHADFDDVSADKKDPYRTYGHTWNFIDPRNSDSSIGNSLTGTGEVAGTTSGILSIGRYKDESSQFRQEADKREWIYAQRQTGSAGGYHDPYYMNVYDMVGDNADMIWETEGLWFETDPNYSIIYNENDAQAQNLTDPLAAVQGLETRIDPDRYVGLLPDDGGASSFTIPGLKEGDRVLIYMKSGESSGANGIFLNVHGAKDAIGTPISSSDLYKAGGTNWQHKRYEGCYHFIKDDNVDPTTGYGNMKFDMVGGSMCKLLYIRIYTGQRISTTNIVSTAYKRDETGAYILDDKGKWIQEDSGRLLFINDKGANYGQNSQMSLRFRGKGQSSTSQVLTYSGNLNDASFSGNNFKVSGQYNHLIDYTSKVGEIGMFRLRMNDVEYTSKYVADFCDRNFTVGYRDKVDEYPYTWDFTDIQGFSSDKMSAEAGNYPIDAASQDAYGHEWDISLFDANGNMKVNTGYDPITNNLIFSPHKIGYGNQLWAGGNVIPETRGLWFYSEDDSETGYSSEYSSALYNDCLQITSDGIRFANVPDQARKRVAWWNYKMVVPDVPADGAVYLRMKRDTSVPDDAKTFSTIDNADVPFLAARFQFASQNSKTDMVKAGELKNGTNYSFYKVPNTTDEYIVAVKNTTGNVNHLTFTLNGWIVKKVAVSTYQKTVNKLGWATESRNRFIDPELTPFFTGEGVETCTVTGFDYPNKTVTLKRVAVANYVMKPVSNENNEAYLIHNTNDKAVQILDDGFHLFVPDMHDYVDGGNSNVKTPEDMSNSKLKAQLNEGDVSSTDNAGNTNFVLTYKFRQVDSNDNVVSGVQEANEVSFYRVLSSVHSKGNQGYLPVPTSEWKKKTSSTAKFALIFVDEEEEETGVVTGVENVSLQSAEKDVFYNLNGQKLNGAPTESGIYIRNGKKVLVKMF